MFISNNFLFRTRFLLFFCALLILPAGCGEVKFFGLGDEEADLEAPAKELLINGMDEYQVGKYHMAVKYFDKILDLYPFSPEAPLAGLKAADCHYYMKRYPEALLLYDEFEERHPTNQAMAYVMYQKAMCSYNQMDRVDRDVTGAVNAIQDFSRLVRAFPGSPYTEEAKVRIKTAREFLVHHEYFVVRFYLRTKKYDQAKARLKYLIANYPESVIVPKARELLARLESGKPPKLNISSYFPDFKLPKLHLFSKEGVEEEVITE
ncbi:MAG: outer membrane protein assembly factor BamD [Deltaproteobacteria bacterium]|nr:MAG: outer membrane protein assembly factor BamD [Deltaproteobacteria bacterium]